MEHSRCLFIQTMTRSLIKASPQHIFVFGDNVARKGNGGQAYAARGEPNAIGVATKWRPSMEESAFFTDTERAMNVVIGDLARVRRAWESGATIAFPLDGLGTGRAQLPHRAPKIHRFIVDEVHSMAENCPWL